MQLNVSKSRSSLRTPPPHISNLVSFVTNNMNEGSLFVGFCRIIKNFFDYGDFQEYLKKWIPQTKRERELFRHLSDFYCKAARQGNLDNQRGSLLEYLVEALLKMGKYQNLNFHYSAKLNIANRNGKVVDTISPNDIDFYLDGVSTNQSVGFECQIRVWDASHQLLTFNNFAGSINKYQLSCVISLIHMVNEERWVLKYKGQYPNINFIGPTEVVGALL